MPAPAPVSSRPVRPVRLLLARGISIFGHPLLLMPAAGALAWFVDEGAGRHVLAAAIAWGFLATVVLGYSWWRVGNGDWSHVDASRLGERRHLNRFLLVVLVVSAAAGALLHWPTPVLLGLLLSAVIVLAAALCGRWCKPSLHQAFAMFAAAILQVVSPWALLGGVLLALAIAWSRLILRRHVAVDLWCGVTIGGATGLVFWLGLARLADYSGS